LTALLVLRFAGLCSRRIGDARDVCFRVNFGNYTVPRECRRSAISRPLAFDLRKGCQPERSYRDSSTCLAVGPPFIVLQSEQRYDVSMVRNEEEQSDQSYELLTVQCRMARAALAWAVRDFAGAARLSADTVTRLERGQTIRRSTLRAIRVALEKAGCEFICEDDVSGPGVRLRKKQVRIGG
jgi:hypothetical protein